VHIEARRHARGDRGEELPKFTGALPLMKRADHFAARGVERREQRRRPVARVVVRTPFDVPRAHGEDGLGAVERLDLRLLVDAEHERFVGGLRYRPTISRTFSMNSGSFESLNVSVRCGCNAKARHTRLTAV